MLAIKKNLKSLEELSGEFMYCPICENRYSACKGDYFWAEENDEFPCCGQTMIIAREHTTIKEATK